MIRIVALDDLNDRILIEGHGHAVQGIWDAIAAHFKTHSLGRPGKMTCIQEIWGYEQEGPGDVLRIEICTLAHARAKAVTVVLLGEGWGTAGSPAELPPRKPIPRRGKEARVP